MKGALTAGIVLLVSLALIGGGILVLEMVDRVVPPDDDWYIMVKAPGKENRTIGLEELSGMGNRTVEMALLGTGEDGKPHRYTGLLLRDLAQVLNITTYETVTVRAVDTYSKKLTKGQVDGHDALLALSKDGKGLAPRSKGGTGPVRLVLPQDAVGTYNAQHCVKWVSEVVVE